jgi:hypothetical protein
MLNELCIFQLKLKAVETKGIIKKEICFCEYFFGNATVTLSGDISICIISSLLIEDKLLLA